MDYIYITIYIKHEIIIHSIYISTSINILFIYIYHCPMIISLYNTSLLDCESRLQPREAGGRWAWA